MAHTHRRMAILAILTVALAGMLAGGCAVNPVTGERELSLISRDNEIEIGKKAAPEFEQKFGGAVPDSRLQQYITHVGKTVAGHSDRAMPYEFTLVRSKTPNAFALPGGKIFLTAGLMARLSNERQLAAVLGHEIGHVCAKHNVHHLQRQMGVQLLAKIAGAAAGGAAEQVAQVVGNMASLSYSRDDELEADGLGIRYISRTGYNPFGMVELLETLRGLQDQEPGKFSAMFNSHPLTSERVTRARDTIRGEYRTARADDKDNRALYFQAMRQRLVTLVPEVR